MRRKSQVLFGGLTRETHPRKRWHGALVRPYIANTRLEETSRRVQQNNLCHRGRRGDRLSRIRLSSTRPTNDRPMRPTPSSNASLRLEIQMLRLLQQGGSRGHYECSIPIVTQILPGADSSLSSVTLPMSNDQWRYRYFGEPCFAGRTRSWPAEDSRAQRLRNQSIDRVDEQPY